MQQQGIPDPPDVSPQVDIPPPPDVGEIDIPPPPDIEGARPSKMLNFGGGYAPTNSLLEPTPSYGGMQISTQPAIKKPFDLKQYEWDKFVAEQKAIGEKALADNRSGARHFGLFNSGLSMLGAPAENQIELYDMRQQLKRGEITLGDFLARAGRTALGALPFVPPPEVDDKYRLAAFRAGLANEKLRDDSFVDRVSQDFTGGAAFLAKFAGVKGVADAGAQAIAKGASPGLKLLLGGAGAAKTPIEVIASGAIPSAGSMGLLAAEPALEQGRYKDAAVDFAKGVGTDIMFRGASLAGGGAVNQLNKATGGRLPESVLAKLRPAGAGIAQGVAQTATNLDDPNLPEQAASNILTNVVLGYAPGIRNAIPGMKAMLEQQRQRPMDPFVNPDSVTEETRTSDIPLQGDPSFEMMTRGKRAFHFLPKDDGQVQRTPAERALENSGILDVVDTQVIETPTGTVRFTDPKKAQEVFLQPNARDVVVFKRGSDGFYTSEVDIDASVKKATEMGKEGIFLQYGEGNESKADPRDPNARAVTLYDRFGHEVTTILAPNPPTAVKALEQFHGGDPKTGARIVERPMSEIPSILAERAKAKVIDAQQKAPKAKVEEDIPDPPDAVDTTGLTPEQIARQSREKGALYSAKSTFSYLKDIPEAGPVYKSLLTRHSAYNHARQMGAYTAAEINRKVNNPKLISLAMKYLYDAQAEGMVAQGRPVPNHMFLNPQERAEVAANKSKVMEIVDQLRTMNAQNATLSKAAGIQSTRPLPGDSTYVHMTPIDMTMTEVGGKVKFSPQLERLVALQKRTGAKLILADPEVLSAIEKGAPRVGSNEHKILVGRGLLRAPAATKAGAARYATGESEAYSLDPKDIAERTIFDLASASSQNELVSSVRDLEVKPDANGKYPDYVNFGGKVVKTARVEVGTKPSWMGEAGKSPSERWAVVPEPIKMAIEESRRHDPVSEDHAVKRIMSQIIKADTGITLADTPSTWVQFTNALSTMLGVAGNGKMGKFIEAIGGPPRMMAAIVKALDTTGPDYADKVNHLSRHGALDTRSFGESDLPFGEKPGLADRLVDFIPGAAPFQEATFGADGIVNRVKVALYDLARDSGMSDAQALNFVIEKTGTTVDALKPDLVRAMTGQSTFGIPIDPYFNRNLQVLKTAAQALGFNPAGFQKRILAGTLSSLVLWTALANYFATDDDEARDDTMGRFGPLPRDFRLGYVNVRGQQVPFFKNTDPALERALRTFGLSAPIERYVSGDRDFNLLESGIKQAWTTFAQRLGPGFQTIRDIALPTYDRFGRENPQPKIKDSLVSNVPGADAIIKARNKDDELALSRGEEGSPLRRLIRGMTGVFVGGNDIEPKKDIQISNKLYRMDEREREDAILEVVSKVKRALPKRPDGTIAFPKDDSVLRMVNELIKDMPEGPEKNLFRRDAIQWTIGSGVKDIRINNEIRRNGK